MDSAMKEIVTGIYTWSWLSPRHGYNFNGYAFNSDEGLIVIDPAIMEGKDLDELQKLGDPAFIVLTNKDHERMAYEFRDRFGAKIYINEKDSSFLKSSPDYTFKDGETLPGKLIAINIPDNKSPGESAFLLSEGKGVLFIGDAMIGWPKGEFSLLPSGKYSDPQKAKGSISTLLNYDFDTVLVGDGESVLEGGKDAIGRFLKRQDGIYLNLPVQ
jgi:glyoxylase-like metal-dependent hydrolase (beta-lactamase superfamily II)